MSGVLMSEGGVRGGAAEKAAWRERFRRARLGLAPEHREAASLKIAARVLALPEVARARTVHVFWPIVERGEVDTRPLVRALVGRGVGVVLPAVLPGPAPRLAHRRFEGEDRLVPGPWGLREPTPDALAVAPAHLDVVVVPGLAFDGRGGRLGYGGGYYDAFLAETAALRVGVAFAVGWAAAVPTEPHDVRVDVVVTESETVRTGRPPSPPERNPRGAAP